MRFDSTGNELASASVQTRRQDGIITLTLRSLLSVYSGFNTSELYKPQWPILLEFSELFRILVLARIEFEFVEENCCIELKCAVAIATVLPI